MLIRRTDPHQPAPSEITPQAALPRRRLIRASMGATSSVVASSVVASSVVAMAPGLAGIERSAHAAAAAATGPKLEASPAMAPWSTMEKATPFKDVTGYNNFYEFGTDKGDPAANAGSLKVSPWKVLVDGLVARPMTLDLDDLRRLAPLQERIYRMRCVEGWSMVIPWIGYPLSALIDRVEPTGSARYVEFTTLADKAQMPGLRVPVLRWPYVEGLRLDEARHPLTLLTLGLYGQALPNQNGAPVRVVVPWKYGFKSAKSLVRIRFVEQQPATSWNVAAPQEYGFYSNVNPAVDHPRWSQATERRIGEDGFLQRKRKTLPFNGYGEQVASLYQGMDLRRYF